MIEKLIKEDDRRVTEMKAERWYWGRKPLYQSPEGQKLLIALNCLFLMWSQLGAKPSVSHGRDLRCSVEFSSSHLPIAFNVISQESQSKDAKSKELFHTNLLGHTKINIAILKKMEVIERLKPLQVKY